MTDSHRSNLRLLFAARYNFFCSRVYQCDFCITVDADEIKRLGKRFRKLDLDNSGSLSVDEFMSLPELQQNPLVQRVIDIFDTDGNGEVDFKGMYLFYKNYYVMMLHFLRISNQITQINIPKSLQTRSLTTAL